MSAAALTLEALAAALPAKARLIGVDLGTKTIGLALSDVERRIATPLVTLARSQFSRDAQALGEQIRKFEAFALVMGLPLNMDGGEGQRVQSTRAFVRNLARVDPTPVVFWDERLSTAAVTRAMIGADVSRARRAEVVDKMAAAYILQGALDRLANIAASPDSAR
ncbi:MAG: Holliday junction resolvase RuvX [Hyphomicrobiales bacterium]|nr:Holliday junction resolvase RuvX [Hyphomicrobiales bacterium]